MGTLEQVDRAAEIARDADIDALVDGPGWTITDADYPAAFVYDKESWDSDCAQMIASTDAEINDRLRTRIGLALYWLGTFDNKNTLSHNLFRANNLQSSLAEIGSIILGNAIANGLTAEKMGE